MTRVKICGITRLRDALLAAELGASALGFNFYPRSPRYIEPGLARDMIRRLPPFVTAVGVFADEGDSVRVAEVARESAVNAIQLDSPALAARLLEGGGFSVILAVSVADRFRPEELARRRAHAFLLDARHPVLRGGTGRGFDWELAREAARYGRIILAGGLNAKNVAEAIQVLRPFAVDVATGVESAPGVKDARKLKSFIEAVRSADQ